MRSAGPCRCRSPAPAIGSRGTVRSLRALIRGVWGRHQGEHPGSDEPRGRRPRTSSRSSGSRQEVTKITINGRPMVARDEVRILRATLHHAARHGLGPRDRAGRPDFAA
ncbi:MAG TPA: hypothetical protein VKP69_09355 [Isosphaeraceae bacterium]|nr:hypothetical protein [Isosphaeraceae bacterium]